MASNTHAGQPGGAPPPGSRDRVRLAGMQFYGYHGATLQERQIGQRFEVDVEMAVNTEKVVDGDLSTTLDYCIVYGICKRYFEEQKFRLIETIAREIAHAILESHDLPGVRVTVRKPCVPLGGVTTVGAEAIVERGII